MAGMPCRRMPARHGERPLKRECPVLVVRLDLTKPGPGHYVLLYHRGLETLLHEFGHALYAGLARPKYSLLCRVPRDFAEAPAELFEQWCWTQEGLAVITKHNPRVWRTIFPKDLRRLSNSRTE